MQHKSGTVIILLLVQLNPLTIIDYSNT